MKINFEKTDFLAALKTVQSVAGARNALPILGAVRIEAWGNTCTITATDLEIGLRLSVKAAVLEEGAVAVNARKLCEIVSALDEEAIDCTGTDENFTLNCGTGSFTLQALIADEFPMLPEVPGEAITVDAHMLRHAIAKVRYAASTDTVQYVINGVFFNILEDTTTVVATDGRRISLVECTPLVSDGAIASFLLPVRAVNEVAKVFAETDYVEVVMQESQIRFSDEHAMLTTRVVEAEYPDYEKVIPDETEGTVRLARKELLAAAKRVSKLANPKNYAIALDFEETAEPAQSLTVESRTAEVGEGREFVGVDSCTKSVRIGFDARLLIEALSHIDAENIELEFSDAQSPVKIVSGAHTSMLTTTRLQD